MEPKTIIETIDLVKDYGIGESLVRAVDSISIKINEGEFVAIMGPSGSGKSTLMNILACLDRPTAGQYILAGEDVSDLTRTELARIRGKELGFVFQSFNLLPRMTALENVMLPLMYRPDKPTTIPERKERAMQVLESVGLADRAHHIPSEFPAASSKGCHRPRFDQ